MIQILQLLQLLQLLLQLQELIRDVLQGLENLMQRRRVRRPCAHSLSRKCADRLTAELRECAGVQLCSNAKRSCHSTSSSIARFGSSRVLSPTNDRRPPALFGSRVIERAALMPIGTSWIGRVRCRANRLPFGGLGRLAGAALRRKLCVVPKRRISRNSRTKRRSSRTTKDLCDLRF